MASACLGRRAGADCAHRLDQRFGSLGGQPWIRRRSALMGVDIKVEHLNAWFGKHQALHEINMDILPNHATAIIGPSGCGKSTFVRCLNRMHETNAEARAQGKVRINEMDVY